MFFDENNVTLLYFCIKKFGHMRIFSIFAVLFKCEKEAMSFSLNFTNSNFKKKFGNVHWQWGAQIPSGDGWGTPWASNHKRPGNKGFARRNQGERFTDCKTVFHAAYSPKLRKKKEQNRNKIYSLCRKAILKISKLRMIFGK